MPPVATPIPIMPSNNPNTGTRSDDGIPRCIIVKPETSRSALLTPVTSSPAMASGTSGHAPMTAMGRPQKASATAKAAASRGIRVSPTAPIAPMRLPRPTAALSSPTPLSPSPSSSIEATTMSVVSMPRTNTWPPKSRKTSADARMTSQGPHRSRDGDPGHTRRRAAPRISLVGEPETDQDRGRGQEREGHDDTARGRTHANGDGATDQRTDERTGAFAEAACHVRGDELGWAPGQRRHEGVLDRSDERARAREDPRQDEGDPGRCAQHEHDRGDCGRSGPDEVDGDERAVAPQPGHRDIGEGSDQHRRDHAHDTQHPDPERATGRIGRDQQHDEVGPIGGDPERPRGLDPADARVAGDLPDRVRPGGESGAADGSHRPSLRAALRPESGVLHSATHRPDRDRGVDREGPDRQCRHVLHRSARLVSSPSSSRSSCPRSRSRPSGRTSSGCGATPSTRCAPTWPASRPP